MCGWLYVYFILYMMAYNRYRTNNARLHPNYLSFYRDFNIMMTTQSYSSYLQTHTHTLSRLWMLQFYIKYMICVVTSETNLS